IRVVENKINILSLAQYILLYRGVSAPFRPRVSPGLILAAFTIGIAALVLAQQAHAQAGAIADSIARADSLRADSLQKGLLVPGIPGLSDTLNFIQQSRLRDSIRIRMIDSLRGRRDSLGILRDSLRARRDTTKIDTTWIVYRDSTSRLRQ